MNDYYVYVYIDPRNYEEFYYGKGKGSRKDMHFPNELGTDTERRIAEIQKEGLRPIIRVIARGLSEDQAFLVEKTLLWKLGKWTTNVAMGSFADKFRPLNTLHKELANFDYHNGFYYYNVGEGPNRSWDDYAGFGFISAGQGRRWRDAIRGFSEGDVFAAYLKRKGYVGIGRITSRAEMIREVRIEGKPLLSLPLHCGGTSVNSDNTELSEYVCLVKWVARTSREEARWKPGLYTTTHARASLEGQKETLDFLQKAFDVDITQLIR